jgi:hypothetical protein
VLSKSRIFKFLKRDCGTIPVAEITSGKILLPQYPWQPSHFMYCDAPRIISEFIKISGEMLVLEKILKTTRFL